MGTKSVGACLLPAAMLVALLFLTACGSASPAEPQTMAESQSATVSPTAVPSKDETPTSKPEPEAQQAGATSKTPNTSDSMETGQTPTAGQDKSQEGAPQEPSQSMATAAPSDPPVQTPDTPEPTQAEPTRATTVPPTKDDYTGPVGGNVGDRAPEIEGIVAWINSDPVAMTQLRGKVVLVDFWTYTCINCIRTYPFLKLWNARYADDGLVILGIHSPEFEFEKDLDNVKRATEEDGIIWPVALDNDFETWNNYSNRYWPAKYLIDKDGFVRYSHFGEGRYAETEEEIQKLLKEAGAQILVDEFAPPEDQLLDADFLTSERAEITRELYAGYQRNFPDRVYGRGGYAGQDAYYLAPDEVVTFALPGNQRPHLLYFQGPWKVGPENVTHGRESQGYEDSINLVFSARSINAVLTSGSEEPYKVRVKLNGEYLTPQNKGVDVTIGKNGESYIMVTEPRMYNIVENPAWVWRHRLQMSSNSKDFGLFAFTFGTYQKDT